MLEKKLELIKENIPRQEWKYFHIESIENFLYHLDSIKSARAKDKIKDQIDSYLDKVEQERLHKENLSTAYKKLYSERLYKIATFYQDELGFISKPYYPLIIILALVLFTILFLITNFYIAILSSTLLLIVYILHIYLKIKSKKYF